MSGYLSAVSGFLPFSTIISSAMATGSKEEKAKINGFNSAMDKLETLIETLDKLQDSVCLYQYLNKNTNTIFISCLLIKDDPIVVQISSLPKSTLLYHLELLWTSTTEFYNNKEWIGHNGRSLNFYNQVQIRYNYIKSMIEIYLKDHCDICEMYSKKIINHSKSHLKPDENVLRFSLQHKESLDL